MAKKSGISLTELVVVMVVISFLLCVLMPSLLAAKQRSKAMVCMSKAMQLSEAWIMFADDNDGRLVDSAPRQTEIFEANGETGACFVTMPQEENGTISYDELEDELRGIEKGALWDYYENHRLMHCPSDKRYQAPAKLNPSRWGGYRSYSIGAVYSIVSLGSVGIGTHEGDYVTLRYDSIISPSEKFVWIEEADGYGYNENTFNIFISFGDPPPFPVFWDPVAVWHNEHSTFGYADGHADRYKWSDEYLIEMGVEGEKMLMLTNIEDYEWFRDGYIPR